MIVLTNNQIIKLYHVLNLLINNSSAKKKYSTKLSLKLSRYFKKLRIENNNINEELFQISELNGEQILKQKKNLDGTLRFIDNGQEIPDNIETRVFRFANNLEKYLKEKEDYLNEEKVFDDLVLFTEKDLQELKPNILLLKSLLIISEIKIDNNEYIESNEITNQEILFDLQEIDILFMIQRERTIKFEKILNDMYKKYDIEKVDIDIQNVQNVMDDLLSLIKGLKEKE